MNSNDTETLVVLNDNLDVIAAYRIKGRDVLVAFLTLVSFLGFDKYYLVPKGLRSGDERTI